jgi:hypothetical protein
LGAVGDTECGDAFDEEIDQRFGGFAVEWSIAGADAAKGRDRIGRDKHPA